MKLIAILLALYGVLPLAAQEARPAVDTSSLTRQERAVLEYLKKDWEKEYRTTSIAVASEAVKVKLSDASRFRLAKFIEANRMSYRAPARHRTTTVALSPTEKLTARAILLLETDGRRWVTPTEISEKMNLPTRSLREPLAFPSAVWRYFSLSRWQLPVLIRNTPECRRASLTSSLTGSR